MPSKKRRKKTKRPYRKKRRTRRSNLHKRSHSRQTRRSIRGGHGFFKRTKKAMAAAAGATKKAATRVTKKMTPSINMRRLRNAQVFGKTLTYISPLFSPIGLLTIGAVGTIIAMSIEGGIYTWRSFKKCNIAGQDISRMKCHKMKEEEEKKAYYSVIREKLEELDDKSYARASDDALDQILNNKKGRGELTRKDVREIRKKATKVAARAVAELRLISKLDPKPGEFPGLPSPEDSGDNFDLASQKAIKHALKDVSLNLLVKISNKFKSATMHKQNGDLKSALSELKQVLKLQKPLPSSHQMHSIHILIAEIKEEIKEKKKEEEAAGWWDEGVKAAKTKHVTKALKAFRKAAALKPNPQVDAWIARLSKQQSRARARRDPTGRR